MIAALLYNTDVTNTFKKYEDVTEITRELLGDLVEKIIIDKDKNVRIVFKFKDEIKNIPSLKLN